MNHRLMLSFAVLLCWCTTAFADPDRQMVTVELNDEDGAIVSVSDGTSVSIVRAVLAGLERSERKATTFTVLPIHKMPSHAILPGGAVLPGNKAPSRFSVYIDSSWERGATTAHIITTPEIPFVVVDKIGDELSVDRKLKSVRLLSSSTFHELLKSDDKNTSNATSFESSAISEPNVSTEWNKPSNKSTDLKYDSRGTSSDLVSLNVGTGRFVFGGSVNSDLGLAGEIMIAKRTFDGFPFPMRITDLFSDDFKGTGQGFRLEFAPSRRSGHQGIIPIEEEEELLLGTVNP